MNINKAFLFVILFVMGVAKAQGQQPMDRYKVIFTNPPQHVPTSKTPDAPLTGNGDIGLTMGGTPDNLRFYIGKNDFWRAYPVYPGGIALPGGLDIVLKDLKDASYYAEQLPGSAEIVAAFSTKACRVRLSAWVAATANKVVIELQSDKKQTARIRLWAAEGNTSSTARGNTPVTWVSRSFENIKGLSWHTHVALAMNTDKDELTLHPGEAVRLVIAIYTNHDTEDWKNKAISEAAHITEDSIGQLKQEHRTWWANFWNLSHVEIGDSYFEKYYYQSQYLFACSSRKEKFAPGIWGPFVTQDEAAWGGDYHLNYNYQAPYWASFSSNHICLTENFDQPLLDYMEAGRKHARKLLNCNGIYYPVGIGPKGLCTSMWPLTPEEMQAKYATRENTIDDGYKFLGQKINAVFSVGNMLMRHYSTYDKEYAQKVYPYLLACADFWEDYLSLENGRYVIRMDHFNEVMPNKRNGGIWRDKLGDFNSTLSLGLVRMLFQGVWDMSVFLTVDEARRVRWTNILQKLSDYPTGMSDGRLSLKNMERGPQNREIVPSGLNRVSIHGLILPGGVMGPVTDSVFNAMLLGDVERWSKKQRVEGDWGNTLNNGIETCYPGAVRVGYPSDEILFHLKKRIELDVHPNGWIVQGGGGIETLAAVPLTINEMLLQSYEGVIRLFPNWNRQKDASFANLRAYGAFLITSSLKNGIVQNVDIVSEKGRLCKMENPWGNQSIQIFRGGRPAEILCGKWLQFPTIEGEEIMIKCMHVPVKQDTCKSEIR